MKTSNKASAVVRKVAPPILTIGASVAILGGALWLHNIEHQNNTLATASLGNQNGSNTAATQLGVGNSSSSELQNPSKSHSGTPKNSTNSSGSSKSGSKSGNSGSTKSSSSKTSSKTSTKSPTGDIGFSPVTGGSLEPSPNPGNLDLTQPFSSVVEQYGTQPQTSFDPTTMQFQYNINVTLDKSVNASIHQILVLPLQQGVLWAIIPATGTNQGTPIYYTVYGNSKSSPNDVVLSLSAQKLGVIPASIASTNQIQTNWYHPAQPQKSSTGNGTNNTSSASGSGAVKSQSMQGGNVTSNNSAGKTNSTNSTSKTNSSNSTNDTNSTNTNTTSATVKSTAFHIDTAELTYNANVGARIQTIADTSTSMPLLLNGLYQVDGGAIITIDTASGTWAYLWKEQQQALLPICAIKNTSTQHGWIAIGSQTVYWGQRSLISSTSYYQGSQHMMELASTTHPDTTYTIKLGSWTEPGSVVAGKDLSTKQPDGNTNEDNLYFRVKNSQTWKEFIPDKHP